MSSEFDRLVPLPRRITPLDGRFEWGSGITVVSDSRSAADRFAAGTLCEACRVRGMPVPQFADVGDHLSCARHPLILAGDPCSHLSLLTAMRDAGLDLDPRIGDEGYLLVVAPGQVMIAGNTSAAVYYGFQTLIQLLPDDGSTHLPCVRIDDWPGLRQRGISMDLGRGEVLLADQIEAEIARIAHHKMNQLVLYLEDAFEFPSHPDIGEGRDRLTASDARRLDAFAGNHHVMLVPCLDSPGHLEHLLSHPNYAHLAEGTETDSVRMVINVTHPQTLHLLCDLYGDLCDAFTSPFIHMGGDEAVALGKGAAKCEADQFGAGRLFARHLKGVRDFVATRGRRIVCWADPFEPDFFKPFGLANYGLEALNYIPRDVLLASWHYGRMTEFTFGPQALDMGFDLQLWTAMGSHELLPTLEMAAENVETFVPCAHRLGALGAIHSHWGDVNSLHEYLWPSNAHFAEWAWRPDGRPWAELLPIATESHFGSGAGDLAAVFRCFGDAARYFGWAVQGIGAPVNKAFFDPMEPHQLDAGQMKLLSEWRVRCREARAALERGRRHVVRELAAVQYLDFALDQCDLLVDIVECRHLLATNLATATPLLAKLAKALPLLAGRYETLWLRARMPLGLKPNLAKYAALTASVKRVQG